MGVVTDAGEKIAKLLINFLGGGIFTLTTLKKTSWRFGALYKLHACKPFGNQLILT